ncbi:MAG: PEP-CTERM sorting domain-containing protein [Verrucomicrobia bacterium]|nr:PEP-CTERM sorting domain-containing protein [Verrucomicrobiota bacterium]MCF7707349.1 PEP-CTERM sorting domain-containing protein [Verrucomicrobiota bacterium]
MNIRYFKQLAVYSIATSAIAIAGVASALAQPAVVYDNSSDFTGSYYPKTSGAPTIGDEIFLAGTERTITTFQFDYYADFLGTQQAKLYMYANDGASVDNGVAPSTVLYETELFNLEQGYNTVTITDINEIVPRNFTWAVSFSPSQYLDAGLLVYENPTVGSSWDDVWVQEAGQWKLKQFGDLKANLGAKITAVPEFSTIQYALLGGLIVLGACGYRRFSSKTA